MKNYVLSENLTHMQVIRNFIHTTNNKYTEYGKTCLRVW